MKRLGLLIGLCAVFLISRTAFALDLRVGAEFAQISASQETDPVQTIVPSLFFGTLLARGYTLFGELNAVDYTTTMTGDRSAKTLGNGSLYILGAGVMFGLMKSQPVGETGALEGRIAGGVAYYDFTERLIPGSTTAYGPTYEETVTKDDVAAQFAVGLDYVMSDGLRLGIEFREVNLAPRTTVKYTQNGQNFIANADPVLSTTWTAFRIQFPL